MEFAVSSAECEEVSANGDMGQASVVFSFQGSERDSHLLTVTQLVSSRARIQT